VFSDKMEYVVFRPYWNVTPDIAAKEFFPKYGSNLPAGYETYTENGQLRIRQRPGPKNSLGLVKFLFPNDFNIYLHDTPNDNLFDKDVRAFSHGCIRLEKPAELAQWVLGWDADRVHQALENGPDNRTITLPKKLPVFIVYTTAYMRDGQLWFGNDLYKRDDQLAQAVLGGAMPSAQAVAAVDALRKLTS
jgi:murein L,D-transpeptidase YcbB/YkuD